MGDGEYLTADEWMRQQAQEKGRAGLEMIELVRDNSGNLVNPITGKVIEDEKGLTIRPDGSAYLVRENG